jgi:hypothetical protein
MTQSKTFLPKTSPPKTSQDLNISRGSDLDKRSLALRSNLLKRKNQDKARAEPDSPPHSSSPKEA